MTTPTVIVGGSRKIMDVEREKTRRFRVHVVQELYQTERDYVEALEFTVNHILAKIRLKAEHDHSFTPEIIGTLFCNVEELLDAHRALLNDLDHTLDGGPHFDSPIASCYLKHAEALRAYKQYGENNEHAQKVLYELEEQPTFKAFFLGIMLLGGKCDASISAYLFKPIQRICKYPLLFRELLKYTPEGHSEHQSTLAALQLMREFCSKINEAKRRVERLEAIADWQNTVDGWEGSAVVDTCSELVMEAALIKISAGNIQERVFTLFDNLLVYSKRITGFPLRSRTGLQPHERIKFPENKALLFRGRIPVANIEMENITDGTGDYHTSGVTVTNGWKIRNIAKDKWFVVVAKSATEKQQWMEIIRSQRDRINREAAGRAKDTRALMVDKGEKLHRQLRQESLLLQDHRFRLRTYPKSFFGSELVQWLVDIGEATDSNEAVRLGQGLLENGVIHNVSDKHQFKNTQLLYRFRYDDGTFRHKWETSDVVARGVRVYAHLHSLFSPLVKDHRVALRTLPSSIHGQRLVDWLVKEKYVQKRDEGVAFGAHLMAIRMLKHVTDDQKFKDSGSLYYQFCADACAEERKKASASLALPTTFCSTDSTTYISLLIPHTPEGYGFELKDGSPVNVHSVISGSTAESLGICAGMDVLGIEEQWLPGAEEEGGLGSFQQCMLAVQSCQQEKAPLHLYLHRTHNEELNMQPGGNPCGFQIKGTSPAIVLKVEPGSLAARHGLTPGCCIQKVEGEDIAQASHDKIVGAIKRATQCEEGVVNLRVGVGGISQVTRYQYATEEQINVQVMERVEESPYLFVLPVQLFKVYEDEMQQRVKLLSSGNLSSSKVEHYLTELKIHVQNYKKVQNSLSKPRYPSYRPYGVAPTAVMESCPTNLHTTALEVQCCTVCGSPTSSLPQGTNNDGTTQVPKEDVTEYFWCSMAIPSLMNRNLNATDIEVSKKCSKIRQLLAGHNNLFSELQRDISLLKRLSLQSQSADTPTASNLLESSLIRGSGDFTPTSSPTLQARNPFLCRQRNVSFANPDPLIKLVLDGVSRKLLAVERFLVNEALMGVLEESCPCVKDCDKGALAAGWRERVQRCREELANLPSPDQENVHSFSGHVDAFIKTTAREVQFHLEVAISLCDNVDSTYAQDRLFSQCLTAVVTAFAYHLHAATKARLNPASEYSVGPKEASYQWLEMVSEKGVLLCVQCLLLPSVTSELASLRDMSLLLDQLQTVSLHVKEAPDDVLPRKSVLPPFTLSGDHSQLHITFQLPAAVMDTLPEALASGMGLKISPVLFNKGLQPMDRSTCNTFQLEQDVNEMSLVMLKSYYRSLRQFHLNTTRLPDDEAQRTLVLEQILQPLNAMEILVQQIEGAIRETGGEGVGLLTLVSELLQRMGGVSIWMCNSGVHRSQAAASLAQVMMLVRSHGLVSWSLHPALSSLRAVGALQFIEKRNGAASEQKSFPYPPPWLYQL